MDRLKAMKENLISCVQAQICGGLKDVDAKELGEAVDMIKDLEEAMYYCTIIEAMEEAEEEKEKNGHHQQQQYPMYYPPVHEPYRYYPYYRDMDRDFGRMYYPHDEIYYNRDRMYAGGQGGSSSSSSGGQGGNPGGGRSSYMEGYDRYPVEMRDHREGRSPIMRKSYMESKEMHKDTKVKMHELEKYMQELTQDIVEMIEGATPEEKQVLQQKLAMLTSKIK